MNKNLKTIAAFDFDGTISYRDILIPFFRYAFGTWATLLKLLVLTPQLIGFPLGLISRQDAKERVLTAFLKGMPISSVNALGNAFATDPLLNMVRPKAIERLKWHQNQGHTCILISANLSFLIFPWADLMGFDYKIASEAAIDQNSNLTGKLIGKNCRGEEKVRRLKEISGPKEGYVLYAYGDSRGDKEHLAYSDYPYYRPFT